MQLTRSRSSRNGVPAGRSPASEAVAHFGTSTRSVATCRVCGRTLLMGERSVGFFTERGEGPFEVCELCVPRAGRYGLRPKPSTPDEVLNSARSRSRRRSLAGLRAMLARRSSPATAALGGALGAVPVGTAALPVALAAFNDSVHVRTLAGLHRTLGAPRSSVVPRSATDREVILTVAWEIVWYQFRIMPDGDIELGRGTYLADLPARWQQWNCRVSAAGTIAAPEHDDVVDPPTGAAR